MKTSFLARLLALVAAAATTFGLMVSIADYALPEAPAPQLAQTASPVTRR